MEQLDQFPGPVEIHLLTRDHGDDQGKACWSGLFEEVRFLYQNLDLSTLCDIT